MKRIINVETGEVIERELTEEEIAQQVIDEAEAEKQNLAAQEYEATKTATKDKLLALGFSEEELKIALGL